MPTITVSDNVFAELKSLAEPFVDTTPESVIHRLIREENRRHENKPNGSTGIDSNDDKIHLLDADAHESLTHTRVISASIDGRAIHRPKWNLIMNEIHVLALDQLGSFNALRVSSNAHIRPGKYEKSGFKFLPNANISIQGVDANLAWEHSLRVARALNIPIKVEFEWHDKEGAKYPGEQGKLEWTPTSE